MPVFAAISHSTLAYLHAQFDNADGDCQDEKSFLDSDIGMVAHQCASGYDERGVHFV